MAYVPQFRIGWSNSLDLQEPQEGWEEGNQAIPVEEVNKNIILDNWSEGLDAADQRAAFVDMNAEASEESESDDELNEWVLVAEQWRPNCLIGMNMNSGLSAAFPPQANESVSYFFL